MADFRVEGEVTLDVSDISRGLLSVFNDLKKVDREVNKLSKDLDQLGSKSVDIEVNIDMPTEDFQMLHRDLDELDGRTIDVSVDVDAGVAIADLEEVQHIVDSLDRERINIPVDVDGFGEIEAGAMSAQKAVGKGGAGGGGLIASLVLLGTALIPLGAVAAGLSAGIVGSFATAGVGVGAFAALAVPTIKKVIDANTQLKKVADEVKNASTAEELTKALQHQKQVLDGLDPSILKAVTSFKAMTDEYARAQKFLQPQTLQIFAGAMQFLTRLLQEATPIAMVVAQAIQTLVDAANQGIKGDDWKKFFQYVRDNAKGFIVDFGLAVGNFLTGIANMIRAFDPLSKMVSGGLLDMSKKFLAWSQGLENNKGFQNFIQYVKDETPKAWNFIKQLATVIWGLIQILTPVGEQVLQIVTDVLGMANAFKAAHPEAAKLAVQVGIVAAALAPLVGFIAPIVSAVWGFAKAIGGGLMPILARFAPILLPLAGPQGIIVALVAALVAIGGVLAFTNPKAKEAGGLFDTLHQVWQKVVDTGKSIWETMKVLFQTLKDSGAIDQFTNAFRNLFDAFGRLLPILKPIAYLIGGVVVIALIALGYALNLLSKGVLAVATVVGGAVQKIVDFFVWLYNVLVGHSIIPDLINGILKWFGKIPGYIASWAKGLYDKVTGALKSLVSSAVNLANSIKNAIVDRFNTAKNNTIAAFNYVRDKVPAAIKSMYDGVVKWIGSAVSFVQGLPGKILGAIGNLGHLLWDAGGKIISGLIDGIKNKLGDLGNTLGNVGQFIKDHKGPESADKVMLYDAGQLIMGGLIGGIESKQTALEKALSAVSTTISGASLPPIAGTVAVRSTGGATLQSGAGSEVGGSNSHIGLYVAPGAIQVNGGDGKAGQEILSKLTRIARFGQFSK